MPKVLSRPALAGALALAGSLVLAAGAASASPVAVHVRVEGVSQTLFDGVLSTDARSSIDGGDGTGSHPCDIADNGAFPPGGATAATATTALYDVTRQLGVTFGAKWYGTSLNDFFVNAVGAEKGAYGYAVNFTTAGVGGCQFQLAPGSDVLWASNYFDKMHLLKLTGPAAANAGAPVVVNVVDGSTGQPIQGAIVGPATTDAAGHATLSFPAAGEQTLKADKSDSVRSAALPICVHKGNDGTCGTTAPNGTSTPIPVNPATVIPAAGTKLARPAAHLFGAARHRYRRGHGPRVLHGYVTTGGALREVRLRLTRRVGGRCSYYSGRAERFLRVRCGKGRSFKAGDSSTFNYLLPSRLGRGHYSLEVTAFALDGSHDVKLERGRNWSVFDVG